MDDLDDFFAKKGKKKKGKSSKKASEGTDGAEEKVVQVTTATAEEETEWKEVQDTVEISADDLKLQTLSTEEPTKDQGTPDSKSSSKTKSSEEPKGKEQESCKANVSSPWQPVQKEKEPTSPATIVTKMPNVSSGAYVPPSKRKPNLMTDPPDIHSESAFPSLVPTSDVDKKKKAVSVDDDEEPQEQLYTDIHLQNKFSALRTE